MLFKTLLYSAYSVILSQVLLIIALCSKNLIAIYTMSVFTVVIASITAVIGIIALIVEHLTNPI